MCKNVIKTFDGYYKSFTDGISVSFSAFIFLFGKATYPILIFNSPATCPWKMKTTHPMIETLFRWCETSHLSGISHLSDIAVEWCTSLSKNKWFIWFMIHDDSSQPSEILSQRMWVLTKVRFFFFMWTVFVGVSQLAKIIHLV